MSNETYSQWLERIYEDKAVSVDKKSLLKLVEEGNFDGVPFNQRIATTLTEEEYNAAQSVGLEKRKARKMGEKLKGVFKNNT